jgi:hypothetical protein
MSNPNTPTDETPVTRPLFCCWTDEIGRSDRPRTASSVKTYCYSLKWMDMRIDGFTETECPSAENIIEYMDEHNISMKRRQSVYTAMKVLLNTRNELQESKKFAAPLLQAKRAIQSDYDKQQRTDKQKANWMDYAELKTIAKELKAEVLKFDKNSLWDKDTYAKAVLCFILHFHLKNPIRRDLCTVEYNSETPEKGNVLVDKKITFRDHKVKRYTPEFHFELDRVQWRLLQLIRKQHTMRNVTSGRIFLNRYWRGMSRNGFTTWLRREMGKIDACKGKNVGCLAIRHSVITHTRRNDTKYEARKEFARRCMHSCRQNEDYRVH